MAVIVAADRAAAHLRLSCLHALAAVGDDLILFLRRKANRPARRSSWLLARLHRFLCPLDWSLFLLAPDDSRLKQQYVSESTGRVVERASM